MTAVYTGGMDGIGGYRLGMIDEAIGRKHEAYMELAHLGTWLRRRDAVVTEAVAAGITKKEVAAVIGVSIDTIYKMIAREERRLAKEAAEKAAREAVSADDVGLGAADPA